MTDYSGFSAEDFAMDDYFIQWVKSSEDSSISQFWKSWIELYPDKKEIISQARQLVLVVAFKEEFPDSQEVQAIWDTITAETGKEEEIITINSIDTPSWQRFLKVASSILLVLIPVGAAVYYLHKQQKISYLTQTAQIKTIMLPDGSQVIVNANSSIQFEPSLHDDQVREVWLRGEAFFNVKKMPSKARFVVHTDQLNIEVLGTSFNVNSRHQKTRVILSSGKVALTLPSGKNNSSIQMLPGDMVECKETEKRIIKKIVDPDTYSSWTKNKLVFNETSLAEIREALRDTQGIELELQDTSLSQLVFSGSVPANRVDLLLLKLSKAFHLKTTRLQTGKILLEKLD